MKTINKLALIWGDNENTVIETLDNLTEENYWKWTNIFGIPKGKTEKFLVDFNIKRNPRIEKFL